MSTLLSTSSYHFYITTSYEVVQIPYPDMQLGDLMVVIGAQLSSDPNPQPGYGASLQGSRRTDVYGSGMNVHLGSYEVQYPYPGGNFSYTTDTATSELMVVVMHFRDASYWGIDYFSLQQDHISCPEALVLGSNSLMYYVAATYGETSPTVGSLVINAASGNLSVAITSVGTVVTPSGFPGNGNIGVSDATTSNFGGTMWVSSDVGPPVPLQPVEQCKPIRHKQRDDEYETPRLRPGPTGNHPTSVNGSFRRGNMNTYDGPGPCHFGGGG